MQKTIILHAYLARWCFDQNLSAIKFYDAKLFYRIFITFNFSIFEFELFFENHFAFFGTFQAKNLRKKWNVINLVCEVVLQVFIVAYCDDKVPDLNSCLALLPPLASPTFQECFVCTFSWREIYRQFSRSRQLGGWRLFLGDFFSSLITVQKIWIVYVIFPLQIRMCKMAVIKMCKNLQHA